MIGYRVADQMPIAGAAPRTLHNLHGGPDLVCRAAERFKQIRAAASEAAFFGFFGVQALVAPTLWQEPASSKRLREVFFLMRQASPPRAFDAVSISAIVLVVMGTAFRPITQPGVRVARRNTIESRCHE